MKLASQSSGLRPQDVLVLLKLFSHQKIDWRQLDLAQDLGLSQAKIANSLSRLNRSSLIDDTKKKPQPLASLDFILHGVKYFYPAVFGTMSRGTPTGHSARPLKGKLVIEENLEWVWPDSEGEQRGLILHPIYETAPSAAKKDPKLHELLALLDSIRAGGPRERKLAEVELRTRILKREK